MPYSVFRGASAPVRLQPVLQPVQTLFEKGAGSCKAHADVPRRTGTEEAGRAGNDGKLRLIAKSLYESFRIHSRLCDIDEHQVGCLRFFCS